MFDNEAIFPSFSRRGVFFRCEGWKKNGGGQLLTFICIEHLKRPLVLGYAVSIIGQFSVTTPFRNVLCIVSECPLLEKGGEDDLMTKRLY